MHYYRQWIFKPNISTLLGNIYSADELKPQKDAAYGIFYMGINIGAFFCNFVAAYLRNYYGWGYAFAAAGVGMVIALIIFAINYKDEKIVGGDVKKPLQKEDMPISKILACISSGYTGRHSGLEHQFDHR